MKSCPLCGLEPRLVLPTPQETERYGHRLIVPSPRNPDLSFLHPLEKTAEDYEAERRTPIFEPGGFEIYHMRLRGFRPIL